MSDWAAKICSEGFARSLGITLESASEGSGTVSMVVREDMLNSHGTAHGGLTFSLADIAFEIACNSHGITAVGQGCDIVYLSPARLGDKLTAVATERALSGRSGIYDITVSADDGRVICEFRGLSRMVGPRAP